jgi:aryl-alcohol dehydrogenase-like predicted oxidoreductase
MSDFLKEEVLSAVQQLVPIAKELDLTLAQFGLAWVLQNPNVSSAIIGASRPEQVMDNVKAVGVEIPDELMTKAEAILKPFVVSDPSETKSPPNRLV